MRESSSNRRSARRRKKQKSILTLIMLLLLILAIILLSKFLINKLKSPEDVQPESNTPSASGDPQEGQGGEGSGETNGEGNAEGEVAEIDPEEDPRFFDTDSYLLLANKKHPLPEGYEPTDLFYPDGIISYNDCRLRETAAIALEDMFAEASREGITLICVSAYRSRDYQASLYDNYVSNYGKEAADTFSARPGYSDHQTALAVDLCGMDENYILVEEFEDTVEGIWLKENAHRFGFIMRYPKGKEEITGYIYEPWHFRYVGIEVATAIHDAGENMTFEEFFGLSGGGYEE